jgi:hypothetical protein
MTTPHKLLLIDESVLRAMAGNPTFLKEFTFLAGLNVVTPQGKSSCGGCARKAAMRINKANAIKSSLVAMGVEKKQRLKKMLNAEKVRIKVSQSGRVTEYTF